MLYQAEPLPGTFDTSADTSSGDRESAVLLADPPAPRQTFLRRWPWAPRLRDTLFRVAPSPPPPQLEGPEASLTLWSSGVPPSARRERQFHLQLLWTPALMLVVLVGFHFAYGTHHPYFHYEVRDPVDALYAFVLSLKGGSFVLGTGIQIWVDGSTPARIRLLYFHSNGRFTFLPLGTERHETWPSRDVARTEVLPTSGTPGARLCLVRESGDAPWPVAEGPKAVLEELATRLDKAFASHRSR